MDRNALAELLQALESRRDAEERRREERYTALIERAGSRLRQPQGEEEGASAASHVCTKVHTYRPLGGGTRGGERRPPKAKATASASPLYRHCHGGGEGSIPRGGPGLRGRSSGAHGRGPHREAALRVDPLPVTKETSEAGPDSTTEGPAAAEVAEGAQEGPPKEQLPRAPPSSDGDTGPEPCVAEEGVTAEPAPEAEAGSADNVEPMQATSAEEPEGEKELPLPEHEPPRAPEASASLSCGDGGFGPRAAAEGDEETSPEAEPTLSLVSEARKGGEEPERAEGGALKADPLPAVQRGQETGPRPSIEGPVPVTEGAQEEPLKQLLPRASLSGGGEGSGPCAAVGGETEAVPVTDAEAGEGPERVYPLSLGEGGEGPERVDPLPSRAEGGPETVPRTSKEGPRAGKTRPSGSAAYAERPSAPPKSRVQTVPARVPPPISPAASPGGGALGESVKIKIRRNALTHQREQGTASGSIRGKRKAQVRLPTWARKCTRTGLTVGVPGGAKEGPPKPKRLPRRPPSTGTATEGEKDPSPEAVRGSAEEASEPMEEAPAERPNGREEPARADGALQVDPLPVAQQTSEAGPDSTTEGPAAAEVAERVQEVPQTEQLPRAPPSSNGDTGPETCVAEEGGMAEPAPEAGVGPPAPPEPMQATSAEGPEGEEELPLPEHEPPRAPEASVGSADNAEPMQAAPAGGSEGGEEPPQSEKELPQASLSCGDGGSGPRAAAEGDKITPPEADVGSAEPTLTLVSGARKGGEEPERAEGGALEVDPLPEVQRGQIPVTEGAREEPLKEQPPRASLSGGDEGSGPCAAVRGGNIARGGPGD
ncbi:UNVERIFIED_CONTAM: hypothetical protein FKN15_062684 [Acipenser sinensis]